MFLSRVPRLSRLHAQKAIPSWPSKFLKENEAGSLSPLSPLSNHRRPTRCLRRVTIMGNLGRCPDKSSDQDSSRSFTAAAEFFATSDGPRFEVWSVLNTGKLLTAKSKNRAETAPVPALYMHNARQKPPETHPGYGDIRLPPVPIDPEQFADAIRSHLIPLASPGLDNWLTEFLRGARLIGLGEGSHGTKEFFQAQEMITRHLIEHHNLRLVFLEVPTPFCHYASEVLESKEPDNIDSVVMQACQFDTWSNSPIVSLLRFIGEWNKRHPTDRVTLRGIDPQLGGSLERLSQSLTSSTPHVDQIRSWCRELRSLYANSAPQETQIEPNVGLGRDSRIQAQKAHTNIRHQGRELIARGARLLSLGGVPESVGYLIRGARLELAFQLQALGRATLERSDTRDKYMAAAIITELDTLRGDQRAAVLGHNAHVSYGPPGIFSNGMGFYLRRAHGACNYKVIVNATASGTVTSRASDATTERQLFVSESAPRGSLEDLLRSATTSPSVIDIHSVAADTRISHLFYDLLAFRSVGCILYQREFVPVKPTEQFDAIIFFPQTNGIQ